MDESPSTSSRAPTGPASTTPVTDRRPTPRGVLPRGVQTWLLAGLANSHLDLAFYAIGLATAAWAKANPGATPAAQKPLFGAWSKLWAQQVSENAAAERLSAEIHAPGPLRSNVPLSNLPAFGAAYGCKAGTPMQRAETEQVRIWR